ncbi:MAG: sulfoxide reductase heme-binding subunit YedZ [Acidobacteria bacterium]|nr:sulfoxide reductase heme-binding subunit YedZ [Acidobacteriota bacterium]
MLISKWTKVAVFPLCLAPVGLLVFRTFTARLGANPIETITHTTGDWTIWFLLIALSITPLRKLLGQPDLIRFRRMTGLFAFFYSCLHFLTLIVFDHFFDVQSILADVYKRPFITVGFLAFVLMIPLAITSTKGMIRRLGKRWQLLHRLVYVTASLGVVHYYWLVKSDVTLPLRYGAILAFLLACRVAFWWQARQAKRAASEALRKRDTAPAT